MKKLYLIFFTLGFITHTFAQQQWITLTSNHPAPPLIHILHSTNSEVAFTIEITGMYKQDSSINAVTYNRLSILQNGKWGEPGYPELPAFYKLIAVPECESVSVAYNVTDSVILYSYNVYPAPAVVADSSNGFVQNVEVFTKNDSVYATDKIFPEFAYEILETSYLRTQKMLRVAAYPFRYNPVNHQLVVYTRFEVTLSFTNPLNDINVNLGYFGNIAKNTLLNYQSDQIPVLPPEPAANPGMVQWVTMTNPSDAGNIFADYLIICDHQFFASPHNQDLTKLANHRASFNGFDVAIVDVQNILSLPFDITNPYYENEQKIRNFIKRVYEGHNAHHTYDGNLAFVLLAGDAVENLGGVPASKDPNPGGPGYYSCYNDYYYSCITTNTNGWYDMTSDIYIGRMCADDNFELSNIVKKTCDFEKEYTWGANKKTNTLACGGVNSAQHNYFTELFADWLNGLYGPEYSTHIVDADMSGNNWSLDYVNHLNNEGSNLVIHYGHADYWNWCKGAYDCMNANTGTLTMDYKKEKLLNLYKYPVVVSDGCHTNMYAENLFDCIGEEMTVFSPNAGYVAYYGTSQLSGLSTTAQGEFPKWLWEDIPYAIYHDLSQILGECILESQIKISNPTGVPWYSWNLLGDPALNVMAPGYEITHNIVLPESTTISTKVHVRANAILSLPAGATLQFEENGQLIIDPEATLVLGNGSNIKGKNLNNAIQVNGTLVGNSNSPNPPSPAPIEYVTFSSLPAQPGQPENVWRGIVFHNPELNVTLKNCTIRNCKIAGTLNYLETIGTTSFINSAINLDESGLLVDQCTFSNSNILLTNYAQTGRFVRVLNSSFQNSEADAIINIDHYPAFSIENSTFSYSNGTGIYLNPTCTLRRGMKKA